MVFTAGCVRLVCDSLTSSQYGLCCGCSSSTCQVGRAVETVRDASTGFVTVDPLVVHQVLA
jgi:hypothetical protein